MVNGNSKLIRVFDLDNESMIGEIQVSKAETFVLQKRAQGLSVSVDTDGDICIYKPDESDDSGETKTYAEMLRGEKWKWKSIHMKNK